MGSELKNDQLNDRSTQFIHLLTSHQPQLYAYISVLLLGEAAVPDVLQETNLHLWAQAELYDVDRPFLPWALGFARQRVMAFRKSCSRSKLVFDDATLALVGDRITKSSSDMDDRLSALQRCLKRLNARQAELIRERYVQKMPVAEMASRLDETAHNVSSQLHRIRRTLSKCIEFALTAEGH